MGNDQKVYAKLQGAASFRYHGEKLFVMEVEIRQKELSGSVQLFINYCTRTFPSLSLNKLSNH